jgi:hypothetical protein
MHSLNHGFPSKIVTVALALMVVTIWLLLRGYHGLVGDGQLYAFQALARIHPNLTADLYLQNTSQDQFTIFSPVFAYFIEHLGLENAARVLTLIFTAWFLGAAWAAARVLTCRDGAWLAVALLLIASGSYGGSGVFRFAEGFLTARLPAEALVATSLACYLKGRRGLAFASATVAIFVHPLIALPGLFLLLCLSVPAKAIVTGAGFCVVTALLIPVSAMTFPWVANLFELMDPAWLSVVQERSQFLFLQLWSFRDWELNARPFFYLAFISLALQDVRIRRLCGAAAIIAAAGLAVGFIAGLLGPVAILVQGQAWRWVWIAAFVSTLLTPAAILRVWEDKENGPLCALLLISGATLPAVNGSACVSLAIVLWTTKSYVNFRSIRHLRWIVPSLTFVIVAWLAIQSWESVAPSILASTGPKTDPIHDFFGLRMGVALVAAFAWWCVRSIRTPWLPVLLIGTFLTVSICALPLAFRQSRVLASVTEITEFSEWESVIPPTSTVLVTPSRDVGTFVWFTLQRPNYLAIDQSAGVVFSRATANEIQRRTRVLLPVMRPNWKIYSDLRAAASKQTIEASSRALTARSLHQICADSQLGFVISPQDLGFDALNHKEAGSWAGWNLYDCLKIRSRLSQQ